MPFPCPAASPPAPAAKLARLGRCLAVAALLAAAAAGCHRPAASPVAIKPPEVIFDRAITRTVTDYDDFTGRTQSPAAVEVRPRVNGFINSFHFAEGAD